MSIKHPSAHTSYDLITLGFKHECIQTCDHYRLQAYELWSIEAPRYTHLKSPNHLSIQAQSSMRLSARTSYYIFTLAFELINISSSKYVHMFVDIKHVNINACDRAIIKEFEHRGK